MIQVLSIAVSSDYSDVALWVLMGVLFVAFVWFIFYQLRQGKKLRYELAQLDKQNENNIESEFVLKAMGIATWHANPVTMTVDYDDDFRDKGSVRGLVAGGSLIGEINHQLHPQDAERVYKAFTALANGTTENYHEVYRVLIPNTKRYFWEESFATVSERDVEGKPAKIVGASMIVNDRKEMELDLIEARNKAEESDRMKSSFIANISHEIRTPLNAIIGFTSLLPDITSDEERKGLLDLIDENSQKLLVIINDMVNISKIESGKEQTVMTNFELNMVLSELVERFRHELKPGVELLTMFASESLMITTDLDRFTEIMKHLLSNATKFTSAGSIVVGYDAPTNRRISIWVRDTGEGIAEENREKVFERFFKVDEYVPGAGLGLSTCRTMAYSLGGTVSVDSKLGEGSRFVVEMPIQ